MSVWLSEHVRSFDVVHIHAVFNHACVAAANACRKFHVPYIIRPLGSLDPWSMKQKRVRKHVFWRVTGRSMLEEAANVHYTTAAEREAVETSLGLNNGVVVPLGVDAETAGSPDSDDVFREFPELASGRYVLVLSRFHPKKALDVLIDAFLTALESKQIDSWRLVLAGDGPADYVRLLHRKVAAANAENRVCFTGWVDGDRKRQLLRRASLLALTSRQENFGVCVMEALSSSVPVIVSRHVNLADEIRTARAGWVTEVGRHEIARTLVQALSSEEDRAIRGSAGKLLSERYRWPAVARELLSVYSSISVQRLCLEVVA